MNILPEINEITCRDKKNLMATFAKLGEEHGELARILLAYANEPTILHRFATSNEIVEECIDVALVALSIAFKAGATEEQVEKMFRIKMDKWGDILNREGRLKDIKNIPFEIHITCGTDENCNYTKEKFNEEFKKACQVAGVKPIQLLLVNSKGETLDDNMTSSKFFGTNSEALAESNRISAIMYEYVSVKRVKIETVPWHPLAPQTSNEQMPSGCYFEAHIAVNEGKYKDLLEDICLRHNAHFSKNINKANGSRMNTIRVYTNRMDFDQKVKKFCEELNESGFTYEPIISEFSLYDTNVTHDKNWLT